MASGGFQLAQTDVPVNDAHFKAQVCRNCGAERGTPHCGACGQQAVARFGARDVWQEFWQRRRWFEMPLLRAALRLLRAPGLVAREYVLGARKRHVHPLKLLLFAVALLVLLLDRTGYLTQGQTALSAQMQLVSDWARWSFSLGLFAVLGASLCTLGRRLGYNPIEHLVLAIYVQFVVIVLNLVNLLPLLVLDTAHWVPLWRAASAWYMTPIELGVVALAFQQFFRLRWWRDGWRIALAVLLSWVFKKALLYGYGRLIYRVVMSHAA